MSGKIRGKVDVFQSSVGSGNAAQECFTGLYATFAAHPNMTLVSRNCGLSSSPGDIGYWDEPNPFKDNAWAVFRMEKTEERPFPYYVQIQLTLNNTFGNAPGNPGLLDGFNGINGGIGVGIQVAVGVGGDENPFKGTMTAGASNDVRADPIWGVPVGGTECHVFPRSNNGFGSHATSKQNFTKITGLSATQLRYHYILDDDNILILVESTSAGTTACGLYWAGPYVPRAGLGAIRAMGAIGGVSANVPLSAGTQYGLAAGTGNQGGLLMLNPGQGVRGIGIDRYQNLLSSSIIPTQMTGTLEYPEYMLPMFGLEARVLGVPAVGLAGHISFFRETANADFRDCSTDFTRAAFGSSTTTAIKVTVPWNGVSAPGATSTRNGLDFVRDRVPADDK